MPFNLINETAKQIPRVEFERIKDELLGKAYSLNLVVVPSQAIQKLNASYRGIDCPTDILSFPLSKDEGEIYISPDETREEAKKFERTYENFFVFLFIHGCAHLKGHDHGAIMEGIEAEMRRKFNV